jgi:hypothetical protein
MSPWTNPHSYPDEEAGLRVKTEVYQIFNVLHKDAREYWNERCAITVAWEGNGITMKQKKKTIKVYIDEPERIVVQAKTLKRPSSKKEENIRIGGITEAHKNLDCANAATICRRPDLKMQYSNPQKRLKRIEDEKCIRRLPQPAR